MEENTDNLATKEESKLEEMMIDYMGG